MSARKWGSVIILQSQKRSARKKFGKHCHSAFLCSILKRLKEIFTQNLRFPEGCWCEDSDLLGCYAVFADDRFPKFEMNIVPLKHQEPFTQWQDCHIPKGFLQLPNYCVPHKKVYVTPISVMKLPCSLLNKMHTAWTLESICIVDNMWDVVPTTKDCYLLHWITCSGSKTAGSGENTSNVLST